MKEENNKLEIIQSDNPAHSAGKILNEALQDKSRPILFLTSGGSALESLKHISRKVLGRHITIELVDERISQDPEASNFEKLKSLSFYKKAKESGCKILNSSPSALDLKEAGKKFESKLQDWRKKNPKGKIIVTLGIGKDGHTAGMMPFPESQKIFEGLFDPPRRQAGNKRKWTSVYEAPGKDKYPARTTVNNTFLREEVDLAVVFVKGEEKRRALKEILSKKNQEKIWVKPGRIIHQMKRVFVCTDLKL